MTPDTKAKPANKLAYRRFLEARLLRKQDQLAYIKRKVRRAAKAGRIGLSPQLRNAQKRADSALATAQEQLQRLDAASDDAWEGLKPGIDVAWEDLAHSVKAIVARFP